MAVTANLRDKQDFLFFTVKPHHKAATTQTLSRWLKSTLKESGINTDLFSSHSCRHATSAARRAGISIDVIRKTAD